MSRQAQLPPRCPLQKKPTTRQGGPHKSISQSSILEEQPPWLNDLLTDCDSNPNDCLTLFKETETEDRCEPDNGLESSCTYGPNSPRRKNKLDFPEKEIVSAFSDYVMQNPMQHSDEYFLVSRVSQSDSYCGSMGESNDTESIQMKRSICSHPGQRSRVRKLQYIAELERSVDVLQNVGSELSVRVASLLQQCAALSLENNTLKQQMLRMQHQKYIVDGEYSSLKKEVEALKFGSRVVPSCNNNKFFHKRSFSAADVAHSDAIWNMLDLRKLDLN